MDNLAIQILGDKKDQVENCIIAMLKEVGIKPTKIKVIKEEKDVISYEVKKSGYYKLKDNIMIIGIEEIDITKIQDLSKEYSCKIYLNFQNETKYEDIILSNGQAIYGKLPDEGFF